MKIFNPIVTSISKLILFSAILISLLKQIQNSNNSSSDN